ncbi:MAG TPA: FecR domain-containing protein, partial [Bryobacteraceae bacterium]|nr:FecR domain-containing protein [Bryobacteraceae bacterium]
MNRTWFRTAGILTGLCFAATLALPQAYTVSAKPGVVNYVEGNTSLNGHPVSPGELRSAALNAGDVLSVDTGKAEVLLTPGVFLRLGNNSQVHMISPSLIDTQLELQRGQAMIEVDQIVKDCRISVLNHGASILIEKEGLYRFNADDAPRVAVIDGKAQVYLGDKKLDLGRGRE